MLISQFSRCLPQNSFKRLARLTPLFAADLVILVASYALAFSVRTLNAPLDFGRSGRFFLFSLLTVHLCLYLFGAYNRIWSRTSGHDVVVILKAMTAATLFLAIVDYALRPRPLPLSVGIVAHALATTGFVAVRYRSRLLSGLEWRWRAVWHHDFPLPDTRILIVGAGDAGQTTAWRLKHRSPDRDYVVVGFVDDDPQKQRMFIEGCRVLGTRHDIPRLAEEHKVDLIIVALHNISGQDFRDILNYCERTKARIKIVPDVFALINDPKGVPLLRDLQPEDLLGRQPVRWHSAVDAAAISHKVVLVTGAAGSIGSELCRQMLTYDPVRLIMLDNNESGLHDLFTELRAKHPQADIVMALADITDSKALRRVFGSHRPQVVFHAAAYKHVPMLELYPEESIRVNVGGTLRVAYLAREHEVERFVLISTDKAVNPTSVMGASKRVCELIMHALSHTYCPMRFTAVRFGNVLGSRGSVVPIFNRQIDLGGPVTVTDKDMTRYFMTIPEAVNLVIHAACLTSGDDLYMLQMGEVVRIVELAERMIRMRGLRPYLDIPIQFTGARPGEKLHEELHTEDEDTLPTLHPEIVQLAARRNGLEPDSFLARVEYLLERGFGDGSSALEQLRDLIRFAESVESPLHEPALAEG